MIDRYNDEAPGHPVREGLRSALRNRGARSVRIRFRAARDGYQPRSYRVEPENAPLPAALSGRLRSLAHAAINESLPRRVEGLTGDGAGPAAQQKRASSGAGRLSDGFGGGDAQPCAVGGTGRADDDVDIASERVEQAEQTLQRILAEVAPQQP